MHCMISGQHNTFSDRTFNEKFGNYSTGNPNRPTPMNMTKQNFGNFTPDNWSDYPGSAKRSRGMPGMGQMGSANDFTCNPMMPSQYFGTLGSNQAPNSLFMSGQMPNFISENAPSNSYMGPMVQNMPVARPNEVTNLSVTRLAAGYSTQPVSSPNKPSASGGNANGGMIKNMAESMGIDGDKYNEFKKKLLQELVNDM